MTKDNEDWDKPEVQAEMKRWNLTRDDVDRWKKEQEKRDPNVRSAS